MNNSQRNIRYIVTSSIHKHIQIISKQLNELENINRYINQLKHTVLNQENRTLLLPVMRELLKWIKSLQKFYNVSFQQCVTTRKIPVRILSLFVLGRQETRELRLCTGINLNGYLNKNFTRILKYIYTIY